MRLVRKSGRRTVAELGREEAGTPFGDAHRRRSWPQRDGRHTLIPGTMDPGKHLTKMPNGSAKTAVVALACALGALASGCGAGATDGLQRQLDALRSDLLKNRADSAALGERLDALELRGGHPAAHAAAANSAEPSRPAAGDRPALDVERLGPTPAGEADAPAAAQDADEGPPAVLRSFGKTIVTEGGPKAGPGKKPTGSTQGDPAARPLDKVTKAAPRPTSAAAPAPGAKR